MDPVRSGWDGLLFDVGLAQSGGRTSAPGEVGVSFANVAQCGAVVIRGER